MSYLLAPRLTFSGTFQADPPTINNDPEHFNTKTFLPSYREPGPGATNGWWNPRGTGAWRFLDCTVQRAVYGDGSSTTDPNVDPVIGAAVNGAEDRVEGKLVDLDSEQQMVSEIWGFSISLRRFVPAGLGATPPAIGSVGNPSQALNALVFSGYAASHTPTWVDDVHPIFQQYANLYPIMKSIVDLGSYSSVLRRRNILQKVFRTPPSNPNYMPVTRDLSTAKREMILHWLDHPHYMNLESKLSLLKALQIAVELEHSTIPPYLCALYSIKEGHNEEVAALIRSVVVEEMLHMALASNIMIAIGGHPSISHPGFVPQYPTSLPGGLRAGLVVRLRRCSIAQIRDVFCQIEEPSVTEEPVKGEVDPADPSEVSRFTIERSRVRAPARSTRMIPTASWRTSTNSPKSSMAADSCLMRSRAASPTPAPGFRSTRPACGR